MKINYKLKKLFLVILRCMVILYKYNEYIYKEDQTEIANKMDVDDDSSIEYEDENEPIENEKRKAYLNEHALVQHIMKEK